MNTKYDLFYTRIAFRRGSFFFYKKKMIIQKRNNNTLLVKQNPLILLYLELDLFFNLFWNFDFKSKNIATLIYYYFQNWHFRAGSQSFYDFLLAIGFKYSDLIKT